MKHMKKSMFITTLAMVVVLVVALSTATFAWYSANTNVNVDATVLQSATTNAASLALSHSNNGSAASGISADLVLNSESIGPMVPQLASGWVPGTVAINGEGEATASSQTVTTYDSFSDAFITASVDANGKFLTNATTASPATMATSSIDGAAAAAGLYVVNTNNANTASVTVAVTIASTVYKSAGTITEFAQNTTYYTRSGDTFTVANAYAENTNYYIADTNLNKYLRVAVFAGDSTNMYLLGVWSGDNSTTSAYYAPDAFVQGEASSGAVVAADTNTVKASAGNAAAALSLAPLQGASLQFIAWFDGNYLTTDDSGEYASFSIALNI
jgi:hypothetical protein